jgi:hypothetical protein
MAPAVQFHQLGLLDQQDPDNLVDLEDLAVLGILEILWSPENQLVQMDHLDLHQYRINISSFEAIMIKQFISK